MTVTLISLDHPVLAVFWWQPGLRCSPTGHLPGKGYSRKVPTSFKPFLPIISELISLVLRVVMIRCNNHQNFNWDTISRKTVSQYWRAPPAYETQLSPTGRQSSIYMPQGKSSSCPWDTAIPHAIITIIIIIIIIIIINERFSMKFKRKFKPSSLKICLYLFINRRKCRSVLILQSV